MGQLNRIAVVVHRFSGSSLKRATVLQHECHADPMSGVLTEFNMVLISASRLVMFSVNTKIPISPILELPKKREHSEEGCSWGAKSFIGNWDRQGSKANGIFGRADYLISSTFLF